VFVTGGGNDNLAAVVARHPDKFVAFAHHNLFAPDAATELERAVTRLGFRGYKLLAPALEKPIDDKSAWPVWEIAERYDIPVLIHFGILGGGGGVAWHENINPLRLHDVARAFPTVSSWCPILAAATCARRSSCAGAARMFTLTRPAPTNGCAGCQKS
jgi:predicted TIM-barrel fold metal-dependent hydrolase